MNSLQHATQSAKRLIMFVYLLSCALLYPAVAENENPANSAGASQQYLVLATSKAKTLEQEVDNALAQGYSFVAGEPASNIVILQKKAGSSRKYRISHNLPATVKDGSYSGYRIIPWSFSRSDYQLGGILESLQEGEPQPEYKVASTILTRNLDKDIAEASIGGFRVIAMTGVETQAALLEKMPGSEATSTSYQLLATRKISTLEKEIAAAASNGFRVVAATGTGKQILVLMEKMPAGEMKREYKVVSTTRSSTFESEINQAAAEGFRLVPQTGAALQKGSVLMGGTYGYEQAIVMEKQTESPKLHYMLVGAKREGTIQRELNAAPTACSIYTMFLTYQESVTVLQCPEK